MSSESCESEAAARISAIGWKFEHSYAQLPDVFFQSAMPAKVPSPGVTILNNALAQQLGLAIEQLSASDAAALLTGQLLPKDACPIAQAYAGHQFGGFTMLGDGRAILLGEHRTPSGQLIDIQFKGSGQTAYSRRGDGRAALGPMLREYIISEAMHALGIPTTRSLAVTTTGDLVRRETTLRGAILTRTAASHIRVGTFQFAAAKRDEGHLRSLADYAIARHYPELTDHPQKYVQLLHAVADRQASLIARWQMVGFIHGVMNTDNMTISGETIDYGPCAFMDVYHPETVFSSIDHGGRYAYGNQPAIGQWNLARLAETLLPLFDADQDKAIELATAALNQYADSYEHYWLNGMRRKLGLQTEADGDRELVEALLKLMQSEKLDFTNTFDQLSAVAGPEEVPAGNIWQDPGLRDWYQRWQSRLQRDAESLSAASDLMRSANPAVIPRNHRVEAALAAADNGDLSVMNRLLEALSAPFDRNPAFADYRSPPPSDQCGYRTFCGT